MDSSFFDVIKIFFVPLAIGMAGYQIRVDWLQNQKIDKLSDEKVTEARVRSILEDKSEVLHMADKASESRIDRLENRLDQIDSKLDKIMDILRGAK